MWLWFFHASLHTVRQPGTMERAVHTPLQASPENSPTGPAAIRAALFGKRELAARKAFSKLPGELSTTSQSPTQRTSATGSTCSVVAAGFLHPGAPRAPVPAGHPADDASFAAVSPRSLNPGWARSALRGWDEARLLPRLAQHLWQRARYSLSSRGQPSGPSGTQHQCPCLLLVELTPACPTESSVTKRGAGDARAQRYKQAQLSSVQSSRSGPSDSL